MRFFPDGYLFKIAVHCSLDCSFEVSDILCMYFPLAGIRVRYIHDKCSIFASWVILANGKIFLLPVELVLAREQRTLTKEC